MEGRKKKERKNELQNEIHKERKTGRRNKGRA